MVGTIEPRKGYLQTIDAFTALWAQGLDANLVIFGKEGWKGLPDAMCSDIPQTVEKLRAHPELNNRPFWLEGISDEYVEKIIPPAMAKALDCRRLKQLSTNCPIVARDIQVFREVAGQHAYYFNAAQPDELAQALPDWLTLFRAEKHPRSDDMPWLTWQKSTAQVMQLYFTYSETIKVYL